jgi:CheY-specific phosphatase CheX
MPASPDLTPFSASVRNVFGTMLHMDVEEGGESDASALEGTESVRAMVAFRGLVTGSATLAMPAPVALAAVEAFTGRSLAIGSADFRDAAGELVNMIAAGVAAKLAGARATIAMPSVRVGPAPEAGDGVRRTRLSFRSPMGPFALEIALEGPLARAA